MRIAFVVNSFPTVSETFILDQVTGMIEQGHDVRIFAKRPSQPTPVHPDVERLGLLDRTIYRVQPPARKGWRRLRAAIQTVRTLARAPGSTVRLLGQQLRRPREFEYPRFLLLASVLRGRFDVIHCHFGPNGVLMLPLKQARPTVPLVVTFHGYDIRMALAQDRDVYRQLFDRADLLMANSGYTAGVLRELGAAPSKICVHPPGVDLEYYRPAETAAESVNEADLRIITVGRLVPEKDITLAVQAVSLLRDRRPDLRCRFDIVGQGPLEGEISRQIEQLALSDRVFLRGYMTRPQVLEALRQADVFLSSSVAEGLGLALLEAQAVGLPVVAPDVQGIPYAVDPGQSALLVPSGDAGAMAEALDRLAADPDLRKEMGQRGRRFVRTHYDIRKLNRALVDVYRQVIAAARWRNRGRDLGNDAPEADRR